MSRKGFTPTPKPLVWGFTLIELVVVIAIIAVLTGSLLPSIQNFIRRSQATRTAGELKTIHEAMNRYLADVGRYPPAPLEQLGRRWGADAGLVDRGMVVGSHLSNWNGPYLDTWPVKTPMGPIGGSAVGAYYVHPPIVGWIDYDGIAGNDLWIHMNAEAPFDNYLANRVAINQMIDTILDNGVPGSGTVNSSYHIYYYVGEGNTSW